MKKRKKESPRKLTENTSPRAKNRTKIFFAKRKKMRGNYCNSHSNVMKLIKIDGFIEWREKAQTDIPQCGKFKLLKD